MSERGYGDPECVAETGDLACHAITTSRMADYGGPRLMHENRHDRMFVLKETGCRSVELEHIS
jgi:hypothetical protein